MNCFPVQTPAAAARIGIGAAGNVDQWSLASARALSAPAPGGDVTPSDGEVTTFEGDVTTEGDTTPEAEATTAEFELAEP